MGCSLTSTIRKVPRGAQLAGCPKSSSAITPMCARSNEAHRSGEDVGFQTTRRCGAQGTSQGERSVVLAIRCSPLGETEYLV
jgi:hypothetical protein